MNPKLIIHTLITLVLLCFISAETYLQTADLYATESIQNNSSSTMIDRLNSIKWELEKSSYTDIFGIVVPIVAALFLLWIQQYLEKRDRLRRSCEAILREIEEMKDSLLSEQEKQIRYHIVDLSGAPNNLRRQVDYRNIYLNTDAFESVLYSGLFTQFSVETQHNLSKLYSRVKSHNDIITQIQRLHNNFLLSSVSEQRYQRVKNPYEQTITKMEKEMTSLAYIVQMNIRSEQRKK